MNVNPGGQCDGTVRTLSVIRSSQVHSTYFPFHGSRYVLQPFAWLCLRRLLLCMSACSALHRAVLYVIILKHTN
jgi:hypothetical protein